MYRAALACLWFERKPGHVQGRSLSATIQRLPLILLSRLESYLICSTKKPISHSYSTHSGLSLMHAHAHTCTVAMATKSWLQLAFKTKRQSVATKISGREADDKD